MRTILISLCATLAMAGPALADWKRQGTVTGSQGRTIQTQGHGACSSGRCDWSRSTVGPRGRAASTTGSAVRQAPGQWSSQAVTTGPAGRSVRREGSLQVTR
jgi:hypothetical protein